MSYSLSVYGKREAIADKAVLADSLSEKGWDVRFLSHGAFRSSELRPVLSSTGPLDEDCQIAGWKKRGKYASDLTEWIDTRQMSYFWILTMETAHFGCCGLEILPSWQDANRDGQAIRKGWGRRLDQAYREADTDFCLRTSAGRTPTSLEFQHIVWEALGELTGGLMEDPQIGLVKLARKPLPLRLKAWMKK